MTMATAATGQERKKVLSNKVYNEMCEFIANFSGLGIECEMEMMELHFSDVDPLTIKSILQIEYCNRMRSQHTRFESRADQYLQEFEEKAANSHDTKILIKMAVYLRISPVFLSRILLHQKYPQADKLKLSRFLKFPHSIENQKLAANVMQAICSDVLDGPLVDIRRHAIGEEYEMKLKALARRAGMEFYDENDLRRLGYDKTPDIKMILPFLYKGDVVNWIESKAAFGDIKSHKFNIRQQLESYCNRFGPGIVIYWLGHHEDVPTIKENGDSIIVLSDFPVSEDLEFMNLTIEKTEPLKFENDCDSGS